MRRFLQVAGLTVGEGSRQPSSTTERKVSFRLTYFLFQHSTTSSRPSVLTTRGELNIGVSSAVSSRRSRQGHGRVTRGSFFQKVVQSSQDDGADVEAQWSPEGEDGGIMHRLPSICC